jgi:hypothetical protein
MELLTDNDISVEYVYSFVRSTGNQRVGDLSTCRTWRRALKVLTENDVKLLDNDQVRSL